MSDADKTTFIGRLETLKLQQYSNANTLRQAVIDFPPPVRDTTIDMEFPFEVFEDNVKPKSFLKRMKLRGKPDEQWDYLVNKMKEKIIGLG